MQAISRWRSLLNSRISAAFSVTQSASFHSTAACSERSNKKWNHDFARSQQRPAKNHIRFVTHEKRDDTKRALKNLLFNSGAFENDFQHEGRSRKKLDKKSSCKAELGYDSDSSTRKKRSKTCPVERAKSKLKRKLRRGYLSEDDERREAAFKAAFGNRSHSWNFDPNDRSSFQNSDSGFEWTKDSFSKNHGNKKWEAASDMDSDDEEEEVGSHLDRTTLGLPPSGPLKIEDVKNAFRLSALKWHPDKHQGCSQAEAEEKFKLCVDAYRSLCNAISAA